MLSEQLTGANDWRSETEKLKSLLRKAAASVFKTWIPDHPEASFERGEVSTLWKAAFPPGTGDHVTFVSMLSTGLEDIMAHGYAPNALSMQELLVQREGTDAFLDPKNALRVVRRKFSMMTLIGRMSSTFEQRNIIAITVPATAPPSDLLKFARIMSLRVEDTAAEEERKTRKAFRRAALKGFDILYHTDLVGRRLPIPWSVKALYSDLGRTLRTPGMTPHAAIEQMTRLHVPGLTAKAIRQMLLYAPDLIEELEAPDAHPLTALLHACPDNLLLGATRNIFDEFQILRREREHARAMSTDMEAFNTLSMAPIAPPIIDADQDFAAATTGGEDDDEFLRSAQALETVRTLMGREFFGRISMVQGDLNFVDTAQGTGQAGVADALADLDPMEGLIQARSVTEAYYRARALAAIVEPLYVAGKTDEATAAGREALEAARSCKTTDVDLAFSAALGAVLHARDLPSMVPALQETIGHAHQHRDNEERAASLMRAVSTIMEGGALPSSLRAAIPAALIGDDVHFWAREEVNSALIEVVLSLLPADNTDTLIFLQMVVSHPSDEVRRSVIRTMPLSEKTEDLLNMLLTHLRDREPAVRVEVIQRIGWSADPKQAIYLVNHFRHGHATTMEEKRVLALNLARLEPVRYLSLFNAMLGSLANHDAQLLRRFKPIKDDSDYQMAALEVLYHLNTREARHLLFKANEQAKGVMESICKRIWLVVKSLPYGDAKLPRSTHDPEYTEDDGFDLLEAVEAILAATVPLEEMEAEPEEAPTEETPTHDFSKLGKKRGLFGRLRSKLFGDVDADVDFQAAGTIDLPAADATGDVAAAPDEDGLPMPPVDGPPRAGLHFEAVLLEGPQAWSGAVPMTFQIYITEHGEPTWREVRDAVEVEEGRFEVTLGTEHTRLPTMPNQVWLGISIDGRPEMAPRIMLSQAKTVVQG